MMQRQIISNLFLLLNIVLLSYKINGGFLIFYIILNLSESIEFTNFHITSSWYEHKLQSFVLLKNYRSKIIHDPISSRRVIRVTDGRNKIVDVHETASDYGH